MIYIDGGEIYLSRGDDASFDIVFTGEDMDGENAIYIRVNEIPEDGTPVRFTVKADTGRMKCLLVKDLTIHNGFVTIPLESKDTLFIPDGDYSWDIRLFYKDVDGYDKNTPVLPHAFHVLGVVGNV